MHLKHGHAACGVAARFWCSRMQFYFNVELESLEGSRHVFTAPDDDAFVEATEVAALLAAAPSAEVVNTIQEIRRLFVH